MIKQFIHTIAFIFFCSTLSCFADNFEVTFNPPKGWKNGDISKMSPLIKSMIVGTGKSHFPPSLTLAIEPYPGTLKEYLTIVKKINEKEKTDWKDLGKINTKAGEGSLSQFDE